MLRSFSRIRKLAEGIGIQASARSHRILLKTRNCIPRGSGHSRQIKKDRIYLHGTACVCEGSLSANGSTTRCCTVPGFVGGHGEPVQSDAGGARTAEFAAAK